MSDQAPGASGPGTVPYPYVSFKTLMGLLDKLAGGAVPPRIDKTVLDTYSGGTIAILLAALRMLDLIGEDGTKTEHLEPVVHDPEARKAHIRTFVEQTYPEQLKLARQDGTTGQLLESFSTVNGTDTKRKVILFYLAAVAFTGLPNSQHFKAPKQAAAGAKRNRRRNNGTAGGKPDDQEDQQPPPPAGDGEEVSVTFGDLGFATLRVNVKWLSLPDETFTALRSVVRDLKSLATDEEGDLDEEDEEDT